MVTTTASSSNVHLSSILTPPLGPSRNLSSGLEEVFGGLVEFDGIFSGFDGWNGVILSFLGGNIGLLCVLRDSSEVCC